MADQENAHLRPACVACTFHCNRIHGDRDLKEEKFDPDRSWPFFRKKMSKLSVHQAPQSAICIPGAFMEDYPNTFQKGKFITLEGPSGNMWSVAAVERSVLYLGWRAFAHDHRLREGDVLNFNLTKPSHFVVDIFNSNGDVRRSARNARVTGKFSINPAMSALQHHSRKRKEMEMAMPSAADRCKTTAKRGNFNVEYTMGPRLKFCEKTKQWLWHEERDGQELVNLDSDDDEPQGQVNRYERSSKIQRLVEFTIEELEKRKLPEPTPAVTPVVNWAGEVHQVVERSQDDVSGDGEENYVAHNSLDEEKEIPGNPLRQFTTMFDTKLRKTTMDLEAEKPVIDAEMKNVGSEGSLSRQAQITSCDRDTVTMKEEQEGTYLARVVQDVEVDNTLKHTQGTAHVESSVAIALPNSSPQPHKIEDCSNEQGLKAESSNPHIENLNTVSPGNILHSAMEACEKTSSTIEGVSENQNNVASNEVEDPYDINFLEEAAAAYVPVSNKVIVSADSSQLTLPTSTSAMLDVKKQTACEEVMFSHPQRKPEFKECNANISGPEVTPDAAQEKEKSFNIQGKPPTPMVKTDTDTCVLISKRGKVAQVDRERALREAQAWVRTIENPNFMAVMNSSHVYTDFNMDIPVEFAKQSKLPPTTARVTLVSDEPPRNCKVIWEPASSKINAAGWMNFSRNHFLEEGDVCVFEDMNTQPAIRIGVYIFRVVELKGPIVLDWERHYKVLETNAAGGVMAVP